MHGSVINVEGNGKHAVFSDRRDAEMMISQLRECADEGETFELRDYQGGRFHIETFYNGEAEGWF